jgi:hypothetical protein
MTDVAIRVEGLTKRFGAVTALDGIEYGAGGSRGCPAVYRRDALGVTLGPGSRSGSGCRTCHRGQPS